MKKLFCGQEGLATQRNFPHLHAFFQDFRGQNHCWQPAHDLFFEVPLACSSAMRFAAIKKNHPTRTESWISQLNRFSDRLKDFRFPTDCAGLMRDALSFAAAHKIDSIEELMNQDCQQDFLFLLFHENRIQNSKTFVQALGKLESRIKDQERTRKIERDNAELLQQKKKEQMAHLRELAFDTACRFKAQSKTLDLCSAQEKLDLFSRAFHEIHR